MNGITTYGNLKKKTYGVQLSETRSRVYLFTCRSLFDFYVHNAFDNDKQNKDDIFGVNQYHNENFGNLRAKKKNDNNAINANNKAIINSEKTFIDK